mgnify:CR=1 FL=1
MSSRRRYPAGGGFFWTGPAAPTIWIWRNTCGVIARQVPVEYEPEALKAQAIIARTYICRQMEGAGNGEEIAESALDMDYLEADQLKKLWGSSRFPEYYKKLEDAVKATSGIVMTYEENVLIPCIAGPRPA